MNENRKGLWACIILIICLVLIMVLSVSSYSAVLKSKEESGNQRGSFSYLRSQIKNYDREGGIELRDGGSMLVLKETDEEFVYELRIYVHRGQLVEEYTLEGMDKNPEGAQTVSVAESFKAEYVGKSLLKLSTDRGSIFVHLSSVQEGGAL